MPQEENGMCPICIVSFCKKVLVERANDKKYFLVLSVSQDLELYLNAQNIICAY